MELKTIALHDWHVKAGAKMAPFAGYHMPISYGSVTEEHMTVRNGVGIFDVSHMGEFLISGPQALPLIQQVTSNDASVLTIGKAQYAYLPNETGGVADDLLVYRIKEEQYMLVVNASNIEKDWNLIRSQNNMEAEMRNISDSFSLFAVQGPRATEILQKLTTADLSAIKYYNFIVGDMAGAEHVIISATGYTGAGGFEIYLHNHHAEMIWNKIMEAGEAFGIRPIGLAARDTLRIEMGYCLYGNDIDDDTSPIEAGLGWVTKFSKDFTSVEALKKQQKEGVTQKRIGFKMIDKAIPRHGYAIADAAGNDIGRVTSGTMSPVLSQGIGMGYVKTAFATPGAEIFIAVRNRKRKAVVSQLPFV